MTQTSLAPEIPQALPRPSANERLLTWVSTVDHKQIGILYLATSFLFFGIAGLLAILMRTQLIQPNNTFLSPSVYDQVFTMHGTTMIFLVVMPVQIGLGVYFLPLLIGARDMAFPRLNALSYWLFLFGGLLLYYSFLAGEAPNTGWFNYAPLNELAYNLRSGVDYWILGLFATGIGTIASGINFIVTTLKMRVEGMSMRRLPLFAWMTFVNGFIILFALPALTAAQVMLFVDRQLLGHFFTPVSGGSAVLWQIYFWTFGHPEVYIMVLPAWGMISEVIPVFSRKPIFGYEFVAGSTVAIAFLSFAVFAHHMFAVGMGIPFNAFFSGASFAIAVPTGIKIFNWIATLWGGKLQLKTPLLFALAFLIQFVMGGITGVSFAVVPTDWQTTDTYYVVAHFHYVLFGGSLFAIFAGIYYWFPKITGRMLSEKWGTLHFWLTVIGFNTTYLVMHALGLMGMTRRTYTYPDYPGWGTLNLISSIGSYILMAAGLVFLWNVFISLRSGRVAGDNPWDAWTLEWATTSPPPEQNFDRLPVVRSRRPLYDLAHPDDPDWIHSEIARR